jgi:hypothetical protein
MTYKQLFNSQFSELMYFIFFRNLIHKCVYIICIPWLHSPWRTLAASRIGSFLSYFRQTVGLLGRVISPSQGLYLHRTTQHRKTRTNIHALSGIRTHDPSNQPAKTHASDRTATVTGNTQVQIEIKLIPQFLMHLRRFRLDVGGE